MSTDNCVICGQYIKEGDAYCQFCGSKQIDETTYNSNIVLSSGGQDNTPTGVLKLRLPIWSFFLDNGNKRYLVMTILGLICLCFGGMGFVFAFIFLELGIVFGLYTYFATIRIIVKTTKSKGEINNIIQEFFNTKQKLSSHKWRDVTGEGWINKEIEVSELPLPAEIDTSGKVVISIDVKSIDDKINEVNIWTSRWTILRWIIPRGLTKSKRTIKQLAKKIQSNDSVSNYDQASSTFTTSTSSSRVQGFNDNECSSKHNFGVVEGVNSQNYQDFISLLLSKAIEVTGTNGSLNIQNYSKHFGECSVKKIKIRFSGNRITLYSYLQINGILEPDPYEVKRLVQSYFAYENKYFTMNGKATSINQKVDNTNIVVETALFPNHIHVDLKYNFSYILFSIINQIGLCANTLEYDLRK